jgi:uncharacterized membrane protein YfcA
MPSELILLIPLFAVIAFFYSSVGLGGGSSYTATLAVIGVSYLIIPTLSLTLNILVTAGATWQFARKGHLKARIIVPFLVASIPAAWYGGRLQLSETVFQALLLVTLVAVAVRIYFWADPVFRLPQGKSFLLGLSLLLGGLLGFVAGAVGIGGGIYLVPIIIMTGIGTTKEASATGAAFILFNSVAGVAARASWSELPWDLVVPLALTVTVAGYIGSHMGAARWQARTIQRVLGAIIIVAILFLARRLVMGI